MKLDVVMHPIRIMSNYSGTKAQSLHVAQAPALRVGVKVVVGLRLPVIGIPPARRVQAVYCMLSIGLLPLCLCACLSCYKEDYN
jgi:hypothetical protein